MTETNREPVVVACSQCDHGYYVDCGNGIAGCAHCGHTVAPSVDVAPYLDEGERLTWTADPTTGARLLAYFPANDD